MQVPYPPVCSTSSLLTCAAHGPDKTLLIIALVVAGVFCWWFITSDTTATEITWNRFKHDYLPYWKHYVEKIEISPAGDVAWVHTVGGVSF
jgi:hypothetical protein